MINEHYLEMLGHKSVIRELAEYAAVRGKEIGKENIISAIVHMDEKTPHMHLCFVPLTADGHLSAKKIIGDRQKLCRWQDLYHNFMAKEFPDLERCLVGIRSAENVIT